MKFRNLRRLCLFVLLTLTISFAQEKTLPCSHCAEWNTPQKPFRIFGNTYYVGPHGLTSVLITSHAGHVLIDGALPESASQIASNIKALGFRIQDVRIILNTHVHFDHAGGIAELQRLSGARVMASEWSASVLKSGAVAKDDPQLGDIRPIAPVKNVSILHDGERFAVGTIEITAHLTPGHTPGGTSWTWRSCEHDVCHDMVYADSLSPISAQGFRFSDNQDNPRALDGFEKSFRFLESTPCDILITNHPDASSLWTRLARRENGVVPDPIVNANACRDFARDAREQLRQRLVQEKSMKTPK